MIYTLCGVPVYVTLAADRMVGGKGYDVAIAVSGASGTAENKLKAAGLAWSPVANAWVGVTRVSNMEEVSPTAGCLFGLEFKPAQPAQYISYYQRHVIPNCAGDVERELARAEMVHRALMAAAAHDWGVCYPQAVDELEEALAAERYIMQRSVQEGDTGALQVAPGQEDNYQRAANNIAALAEEVMNYISNR